MIEAFEDCLSAFEPAVMASLDKMGQELCKDDFFYFRQLPAGVDWYKMLIEQVKECDYIIHLTLENFESNKSVEKSILTKKHEKSIYLDCSELPSQHAISWIYQCFQIAGNAMKLGFSLKFSVNI